MTPYRGPDSMPIAPSMLASRESAGSSSLRRQPFKVEVGGVRMSWMHCRGACEGILALACEVPL